jgi:protein O-mannosyl-transferase
MVVVLGTIAYSNTLNNPFIFDDIPSIKTNRQIESLIPWKYPAPKQTTLSARPVLAFSFAVDYAIGGTKVEIYHLTNLIIHLAAGLLLYVIVRRSLVTTVDGTREKLHTATWLAGAVAAVWIVHPLTTTAVTYTVQRAESLAGLFMLASLYCLNRANNGSGAWAIASVIACGLATASKEYAAVMPVLGLLYDRAFLAGSLQEALRRRWKVYVAMAAMWVFVLLSICEGARGKGVGLHVEVSPLDYARSQPSAIAHYIRLAFCPTDLVLDYYDWPIARRWSQIQWQGWALLALAGFSLAAIWIWPRAGFLGAWFFLILAPSSSFVPIMGEAATEQRMYLPLAAIVCLVVIGMWKVLGSRRATRWAMGIAALVAIALLLTKTIKRNAQYDTAVDIWAATVNSRPNNMRARGNLGGAWVEKSLDYPAGSPESLSAARRAQEEYEIILRRDPSYFLSVYAVGQALERAGDPAAAENFYNNLLAARPNLAHEVFDDRGGLRLRQKNFAGAEADFAAAAQLQPDDPEAHYWLGVLYQNSHDWKRAAEEFVKVAAINPDYLDADQRLAEVRKAAEGGG